MPPQKLTDDDVRLAMQIVLREAQQDGRHPTISAVERRLGVRHATFYRNFPALIDWFKEEAQTQRAEPPTNEDGTPRKSKDEIIADLRRDNEDLRRTRAVYAEALRQLTLDYEELRSGVQRTANVAQLDGRRKHRT